MQLYWNNAYNTLYTFIGILLAGVIRQAVIKLVTALLFVLKFLRSYLFLCGHLLASSFRLFLKAA